MTATAYQDERMYLPDAEVIFSMLWDQVRVSAGHTQPEPPAPTMQQARLQEAAEATAPAFDGSLVRSLALLSERVEGMQAGITLTEEWLRDQTEREAQLHQEMVTRVDGLVQRVEHLAARLETISAQAASREDMLQQQIDELRQQLQRQESQGSHGQPAYRHTSKRSAGSVIRSLLTHTLWLG
jgi:DNA repair exonuclease SbcCD ATPase subunit